MFDKELNDRYRNASRRLRNISSELIAGGDFSYLKMAKSKGDNPEKYRFQIMSRRRRNHGDIETGQECGGLELGSNEINVNIRGPCLDDDRLLISYWDKEDDWGDNRPIYVRVGENLKKVVRPENLEYKINEIGEKYKPNFPESEKDFLLEVLKECNYYAKQVKEIKNKKF